MISDVIPTNHRFALNNEVRCFVHIQQLDFSIHLLYITAIVSLRLGFQPTSSYKAKNRILCKVNTSFLIHTNDGKSNTVTSTSRRLLQNFVE